MPTRTNNRDLPFYIGSDPEFLMFYGQLSLDASKVIHTYFRGDQKYTGLDDNKLRKRSENIGSFGWDGASSTGELRPEATKNIDKHIKYIQKMFEHMNNKFPFVDMTTLSIGAPIGGHIHLDSFTQNISGITDHERDLIKKRANKIIATYLLPVVAADHRISALARHQGMYGKLHDIRYENKTHFQTAEIRGLTAEWLTTPEIAKATLAYVAVVWNEIKNKHKEMNKDDHILQNRNHTDSVHKLLLSDYALITNALVREIRKRVRTFELYPQFKDECELVLNPTRVLKKKERIGWNINKGWGLKQNTIHVRKSDILNDKLVRNILQKEDIPEVQQYFTVNYNDDYNVAYFAKAISERIAVFNWQLKNEYMLFGMHKQNTGITAYTSKTKFYTMSSTPNKTALIETCKRMINKLNNNYFTDNRIDPKTGKTKINRQKILIGLPYDMRTANDIKPMLELIWQIEKDQIEAKPAEEFNNEIANKEPNQKPNLEENITNIRTAPERLDGSLNHSIDRMLDDEMTRLSENENQF